MGSSISRSSQTGEPYSSQALRNVLTRQFGLEKGCSVLVAYSGGLDSQVLLHSLAELGREGLFQVCAAHLDHGLHKDSPTWKQKCADWCEQLGIPLVSERIEVANASGESLEARARKVRYEWLARIAAPGQVVLTAHHADDQAETFLMNLLQGKGIDQLAGIAPDRALIYGSETRLLRPLLAWTRNEIEQYAEIHAIDWIEDPANRDLRHYRNFIRHELMPIILQQWPRAVEKLARAADACRNVAEREQARYDAMLGDLIDVQRKSPLCLADPLSLDSLSRLDEDEFCDLMRAWLHREGFASPPGTSLRSFHSQLATGGSSSAVLTFGDKAIRHYDDVLYLTNAEFVKPAAEIPWDLEPVEFAGLGIGVRMIVGTKGSLDPVRIEGKKVRLCWRQGGEKIKLLNRNHQSSLKKLYQEFRIPTWQREFLPRLEIGGVVAWAPGIGIAGEFSSEVCKEGIIPEIYSLDD